MRETEHSCSALPTVGIHVHRAEHYFQGKDWEWCLVVSRSATEKDLEENHHLDEVGETIWQTVVGISHCPFCGDFLPVEKKSRSVPSANFVHIDMSGWSANIR